MKVVRLYRIKSIYPKTVGETHVGMTLNLPAEGEEFLMTLMDQGTSVSTVTSTIKNVDILNESMFEFTTLDSTYRLTLLHDFGEIDPENIK